VNIAEGSEAFSDPVPYSLPAGANLAVDLYLPDQTGVPTWHFDAQQDSYVSSAGDYAGVTSLPVESTVASWDLLADVELLKPEMEGVIAFGDSITDGTGSSVGTNHRYPDYLAADLASQPTTRDLAVVNAGIGGGRLLNDLIGPSGLSRFERDVLSKPSASYVLVDIGANDIGLPGAEGDPSQAVTAQQIIQGYQQLITQAHAGGLAIYAGTITPFGGSVYNTAADEQEREAVNTWLRSTAGQPGGFDKVVDFDAVVRDPGNPDVLLPAYDSGDHIHLDDAGYATMAGAAAALFTGN
jgi:lysophospholipase L1-like esterase